MPRPKWPSRRAEGDGNLLHPIKDALRAGASIGGLCGAMREVFGEYRGGAFSSHVSASLRAAGVHRRAGWEEPATRPRTLAP